MPMPRDGKQLLKGLWNEGVGAVNFILVLPQELKSDGRVEIEGTRATYVYEFHDLKEGLTVAALCRGGGRGTAKVVSLAPDRIVLEASFRSPPPDKLRIEAIVGLSRPLTVKKVIQAISSLGVPALHLVPSYKGEKSYLTSKGLEPVAIESEINKALEQSGDPIPPDITVYSSFGEFLERNRERIG